MQNTDYKTQINRYISLSVLLTSVCANIVAQSCVIQKIPSKIFHFSQAGLITSKYEAMNKESVNNFQVMFIDFFGISNEQHCHYLSIDSAGKFDVSMFTKDSILFSGCITTTKKYTADSIFKPDSLNGFLLSNCKEGMGSHKRQILIVCNNATNTWIEYVSMDGHIKETLLVNKNLVYLTNAYNLLEKVFGDLRLWNK
jgi:hypothetical protein